MKRNGRKAVRLLEVAGHQVTMHRVWLEDAIYVYREYRVYETVTPSSAGRIMMVMAKDMAEYPPDVVGYDSAGFRFGWKAL